MKKLITVLLLFVALTAHSQILKNSGIIVGVGKGFASYDLPGYCSGVDSPLNHSSSHFKNKIALELGYRFRLEPNNSRFFYDIDLLGRYNKQEYQLTFNPVQYDDHYDYYYGSSGKKDMFSFAVNGSANYKITNRWSVGLGVQPTYYVRGENVFDIPITAKVSYDLDYIGFSLSYQQGIMKSYKVDQFKNIRLSQLQFSVYVPLFKNKKSN